jgi:hypothetical protein
MDVGAKVGSADAVERSGPVCMGVGVADREQPARSRTAMITIIVPLVVRLITLLSLVDRAVGRRDEKHMRIRERAFVNRRISTRSGAVIATPGPPRPFTDNRASAPAL